MSALHDHADAVIARARRAQQVSVPLDVMVRLMAALETSGRMLVNGGAPIEQQIDAGLECGRLVRDLRKIQEPPAPPQRKQTPAWPVDPDAPAKWARDTMDRETHDFYFGE